MPEPARRQGAPNPPENGSQFRENLADRRAAEAVRARIDWKYLLGLELADPGFDTGLTK